MLTIDQYTSTWGTAQALQALHAGTAGWQYECFVAGVWTNILDYYFQVNQNTGYMLAHVRISPPND